MNHFNFNGKIFPPHTPVIGVDNRGLRYGDGLFETIKYRNNEFILLDEHLARMWKGMRLLEFELPKHFSAENLQHEMLQLLKKNKLASARIRLSVIRGDGGLYDTKSHSPLYSIQTWAIPNEPAMLNENGLQLCFYPDGKKVIDNFANLKHNNYLPYFMGAIFAKRQQCNDAVIFNQHDRVCDSTIANIFLVNNGTVYTPPLDEGCVAGVMRKFMLQNLESLGYKVEETPITSAFLLDAEEVFLTNSIYNMRWVSSIENKTFTRNSTKQIFDALLKTNAAVFC